MRILHPGSSRRLLPAGAAIAVGLMAVTATPGAHDRRDDDPRQGRRPKVVLISLDGARPELIERYLRHGVLDWNTGLGRIKKFGVSAAQNITATPSVTAVSHIAIATGSTAVHNDIPGNTFHPVAASIGGSLSGFGAPIGGYQISRSARLRRRPPSHCGCSCETGAGRLSRQRGPAVTGPTSASTTRRARGVADTHGGLHGPVRGVRRGGSGRVHAPLGHLRRSPAPAALVDQITAAGRHSYSPIQVTTAPIETIFCAPDLSHAVRDASAPLRTLRYDIKRGRARSDEQSAHQLRHARVLRRRCGCAARALYPSLHRTRICSRRRAVGEVLL